MIPDQSRFTLADDVTFQSMGPGEDTVMLSLGSGYLFTCNETTASFLRALGAGKTFTEIVDELAEEYDVPTSQLRAALAAMAEKLLADKLIGAAAGPNAD